MKILSIRIKIFLRFPSTLHSTRASTWLGLTIVSRTDLRSVRKTRHAEQVHYVDPQEDHIILVLKLRKSSTSNIHVSMCGYIDIRSFT
jgi:hypothetical protein